MSLFLVWSYCKIEYTVLYAHAVAHLFLTEHLALLYILHDSPWLLCCVTGVVAVSGIILRGLTFSLNLAALAILMTNLSIPTYSLPYLFHLYILQLVMATWVFANSDRTLALSILLWPINIYIHYFMPFCPAITSSFGISIALQPV